MKRNGASIAKRCLLASAATLAIAPQLAAASYKYEYTGRIFPVTSISPLEVNPTNPTGTLVNDGSVSAVIYSPTLLSAGNGIPQGVDFSITGNDGFGATTLQYSWLEFYNPAPFDPNCGPGTPCHPDNIGTFNIGAVDAAGIPLQWNLGIDYSYRAPTGRLFSRVFMTGTDLDGVSGGYEGFQYFSGTLANAPGTWTVSVVPEPATYAMLLAALGLFGCMRLKHFRPVWTTLAISFTAAKSTRPPPQSAIALPRTIARH